MKAYVKPELFFESYELSQHVAACRWDMNNADENNCSANYDITGEGIFNKDTKKYEGQYIPANLFSQNNNLCQTSDQEYCYTNGTLDNRVFQS